MKKLLVVGSLNMDMVIVVDELPRIGQTVIGKDVEYYPGGKGANQAYACGRQGAAVSMIGAVGADEHGLKLIDNLKNVGVNTSGIAICEGEQTGMAIIPVNPRGDNEILVIPGANMRVSPRMIDDKLPLVEECDLVILQLEIPLETVIHTVRLAKKYNKTVILNPAPARELPVELLGGVDFLIPNETELEVLSGEKAGTTEEILAAARNLRERGAGNVLVTLGDRGAVLIHRDGVIPSPSFNSGKVVDTTAAGDCFIAALAVGLTKHLHVKEAIELANLAASIAVTRPGAQSSLPSSEEIEERLAEGRKRRAQS